jgi:hypothetical protein
MPKTKKCRTCLKENDRDKKTLHIFDAHDASGELIGSLLIDCTDIDVSTTNNNLVFFSIKLTKIFINRFPLRIVNPTFYVCLVTVS